MKSFKKGLIHWAQVEVDKVITNEQSLRHMLEKWNVAHVEEEATRKIEHVITEKNSCIFSRVLYIYMGTGFTSFCK